MSRSRVYIKVVAFVTLIVLSLGALSPFTFTRWQGSFLQGEFRLTFVDQDAKPIEGIQLRVEKENGEPSYYFPVTDYSPDNVPTADKQGLLKFHHICPHGPEFGGTYGFLFLFIPVGKRSA